jgi:hypothetical protein
MRTFRKIALAFMALVMMAALALPAFAQDSTPEPTPEATTDAKATKTVTITQEQINAAIAKLPENKRVTNLKVTLGDGQVTIAFTLAGGQRIGRAGKGQGNQQGDSSANPAATAYDVSVVLSPATQNDRVFWGLKSMTINGQPAPAQLSGRIGQMATRFIELGWRRQNREELKGYRVSAISVNASTVTLTLTPRPNGPKV